MLPEQGLYPNTCRREVVSQNPFQHLLFVSMGNTRAKAKKAAKTTLRGRPSKSKPSQLPPEDEEALPDASTSNSQRPRPKPTYKGDNARQENAVEDPINPNLNDDIDILDENETSFLLDDLLGPSGTKRKRLAADELDGYNANFKLDKEESSGSDILSSIRDEQTDTSGIVLLFTNGMIPFYSKSFSFWTLRF